MSFIVYTLEYTGGLIKENICLRNYNGTDYEQYKRKYEDSFYAMRSSLGLPRECCKSRKELLNNKNNIFIYENNDIIIGSVAVYGNEIDDLFVADEYRINGLGLKMLRFAIAFLQKRNTDKIILHVADVNKVALSMYLKNGFVISKSEEIE